MAAANDQNQSNPSIDKPDTNFATYIEHDEIGEDEKWMADFLYLKKQDYYKHLNDINAGRKNGPTWYNDPFLTYENARDFINIISGGLDMTSVQRHRSRRYFISLDRERLGLRYEVVAYCVCAYIVEQDEQNQYRRCHPNVPNEKTDKLFQQTAESLELTSREIHKTYGKLQHILKARPLPPVQDDRRDPDHYPGGGT